MIEYKKTSSDGNKKIKAFDIDWPEDFKIAESIYEKIYK
jgi:CMP-N-acetylneuraminic acid synthetase|tara:strand:- start:343 stop:459 length:117 start_codon:yes stop_codon:yes gene_type:complete